MKKIKLIKFLTMISIGKVFILASCDFSIKNNPEYIKSSYKLQKIETFLDLKAEMNKYTSYLKDSNKIPPNDQDIRFTFLDQLKNNLYTSNDYSAFFLLSSYEFRGLSPANYIDEIISEKFMSDPTFDIKAKYKPEKIIKKLNITKTNFINRYGLPDYNREDLGEYFSKLTNELTRIKDQEYKQHFINALSKKHIVLERYR